MVSIFVSVRLLWLTFGFCLVATCLASQTDTILVDTRGDTLLLRKTTSEWSAGITGSAAVGINTGIMSLEADINKKNIRADFAGRNLGNASAWALGAEAIWRPRQSGEIFYGGRIGFIQQSAMMTYTLPEGSYYNVAKKNIEANALATEFFASTPIFPRFTVFGGVGTLWALGITQAHTTYPHNTITDKSSPSETISLQTPVFSLNVGLRYALHQRDLGSTKIYTAPFVQGVWQPILSEANTSTWGALMLRVGVSIVVEPIHIDTLSLQPLIRWLPIVQLAETPLANVIREEQVVTGRVATARENRDAVLEDHVVIYRPNEKALLNGIPTEALDILRAAVPLLLSRARCRLVLTVPSSSDTTNKVHAEITLGLLVDYLLRRGVEEISIEAGVGENIFLRGEALQLRIRVARDVR